MTLWDYLWGMVEIEMTTANAEETLHSISAAGIELQKIRQCGELSYSFFVRRCEVPLLTKICEKHGDALHVQKKLGLYWIARNVCARPFLLIGGLVLTVLTMYVPTRVLFIRVEGNTRIPEKRILSAAEDCGIVFGASRREVRSESVKNALLSLVPELQWAGVNTSGCTATVSVREKAIQDTEEEPTDISGILADRDGFLLSCTATSGSLMVKPGETVRKGQMLISPYTDCGICIRAERAEGEILAQTNRNLELVFPSKLLRKGPIRQVKRKYSVLIRKKRIFLWKDSGIWDGSCGRMYEEYYVTLPGGFRLPAAFCVESYTVCDMHPTEISREEAERSLKIFAEHYLSQHMIAGKILSV